MTNPEATQRQDCAPLKVSKSKIETIHPPQLSHPQHSQSSELEVIIPESGTKFLYSSQGDLDIPIALRKCIKSCTRHPISKFVSYEKLNLQYNAFISNVSSLAMPKNIQEAMGDPKWREVVYEEMKALKKNDT